MSLIFFSEIKNTQEQAEPQNLSNVRTTHFSNIDKE